MVGITSYGAYVPMYRLKRDDIAKAWGGGAGGGERSVANFDEDSLSIAVAAARDCLKGVDAQKVDAVYFATTTSPYQEKQMAVTVAAACDLRTDIFTADVTDSLRSGTIALKAALDAVKAGSSKCALVVVADCRLGEPKSDMESTFGDGGAAFIVSDTNVIATIEASHNQADEIYDNWRTKKDEMVKTTEDRFVITQGYTRVMEEVVKTLLKKTSLTPKDFSKIVYYAPDARRHQEMAKPLGFDPKTQVQAGLFDKLGNTGAAFAPMLMVAALEEAQPGQRILLANYGDGGDAYVIKTTEYVNKLAPRRGMKGHLASKRYLSSYEKYIRFRDLMPVEKQRRPSLVCFIPTVLRDRKWIFGGNASHCTTCGRLFFPPQRVCNYCQTKDTFDYVKVMDWPATLFTFSKDNLALSVDPPTVWTLVNLDNKLRVYTRMTDFDPDKVEIDMPLEMTFRKLSDAGEHPNYFWKCMPVR